MNDTFSITTTLRRSTIPLPRQSLLQKIKQRILGNSYQLSLVFVGNTRARRLNRLYRGKDYPTNVLAFPLATKEGEIVIAVPKAITEAKQFGQTPAQHIAALFIHGCLHLKGYRHGRAMETMERTVARQFLS